MNPVLIVVIVLSLGFGIFLSVRRSRKGDSCCGARERVAISLPADRNPAHYRHSVRLELGGMTCDNCARRVANALNDMDGMWATVRFDTKKALVRCKREPDEQAIREAVRKAGYTVMNYEIL